MYTGGSTGKQNGLEERDIVGASRCTVLGANPLNE